MTEIALITGASGGIGRALTRQLHARGCRVAAVGRDAGRLADVEATARIAAAKGGVEALVRSAAATYAGQGLRINAVSPTVLTESMGAYGPFFPGFEPVPAARVALAYQRSVEGAQTGRVYRVQ